MRAQQKGMPFLRKRHLILSNMDVCSRINKEVIVKLSKTDINLIELRNKIKLFISKSSSEYLKEVIKRNKQVHTIEKVKI